MKKSFRGKYNWIQIVHSLNNYCVNGLYFSLLRKLRKGNSMSANRCAYCALKSYYSTTTIAQLVEKLGL